MSTTTNQLLSFVAHEFKNRKQVNTFYFDFHKVFDSVSHRILLRKLSGFGIVDENARMDKIYLERRKFRVKVAGELSDEYNATSGIP